MCNQFWLWNQGQSHLHTSSPSSGELGLAQGLIFSVLSVELTSQQQTMSWTHLDGFPAPLKLSGRAFPPFFSKEEASVLALHVNCSSLCVLGVLWVEHNCWCSSEAWKDDAFVSFLGCLLEVFDSAEVSRCYPNHLNSVLQPFPIARVENKATKFGVWTFFQIKYNI